MTSRRNSLAALAAILLLAISLVTPAAVAQEIQRIAAIVNDEVISGFDLERRVELIIRSTESVDSPEARQRLRPEALDILIDEKLRLQAARQLNLAVNERDIARAVSNLERQNNVPPGGFDDFLRANGYDRESLMQQVRAEIAWGKFLRRRATPISDDEIDEELARLEADIGKPEFLISEIYLPVAAAPDEVEIQRLAQELVTQIDGGSAFGAVARQFSRGATANEGGRVGWIKADQLADELARVVDTLEPGARSDPIRTLGGYYIIRLHNKRRFGVADPKSARMRLMQITIAVADADGSRSRRLAEEFRAATEGCPAIAGAVEGHDGVEQGDLGTLAIGQLSEAIRAAVNDLPDGKLSAPIDLDDSLMLLMVCERERQEIRKPDRERVLAQLSRRQLFKLSQRFIRDLRRDALVEYR